LFKLILTEDENPERIIMDMELENEQKPIMNKYNMFLDIMEITNFLGESKILQV